MYPVIKISYLNPLRFHHSVNGKFACETVSDFEQPASYVQKFYPGDEIKFHVLLLKDQYVDARYRIYRSDGKLLDEIVSPNIGSYGILYDVWSPAPSDDIVSYLEEGELFFIEISVLTTGGEATNTYTSFISDPITLISSTDNTLLINYTHDANRFDVAFYPDQQDLLKHESFRIRVEGGMYSDGFTPASKDVFYIDQVHDTIQLDSIPFNTFKFVFGPGSGIPNWLASKLNRILSLSSITINGTAYVKTDGAKLEPIRDKGYPLAGWQIELIEPEVRFSLTDDETAGSLGDYNNDYNTDYF